MKPGVHLAVAFATCVTLGSAAEPTGDGWRQFTAEQGLPENSCQNLTVSANGDVLVRHTAATNVTIFDGYRFKSQVVPGRNRVYESPGGQLWTVTEQGIWESRGGNWGLIQLPEVGKFFQTGLTNEVFLLPVRQGCVFILLPDRLLQLDADQAGGPQVQTFRQVAETPLGRFTGIMASPDGGAWITGTNGFARLPPPLRDLKPANSWIFTVSPPAGFPAQALSGVPAQLPAQRVSDQALGPDGSLWLAASNGLFRIGPEIWQPATTHPRDLTAGPTNKVSLTTRSGDIWVGGGGRMMHYHRGRWSVVTFTNQLGPQQPVGFAETMDGRIWCATDDRIWQFNGSDWLAIYSGLDHVRALLATSDGALWAATQRGIFHFLYGTWLANNQDDGLAADEITSLQIDDQGRVFARSANGWTQFNPDADIDAPQTHILAPGVNHANFHEDDAITFRFQGRDRWNQTVPGNLLFSWRLDQNEWSPFQPDTLVAVSGLGLGPHLFQVRALDRSGNLEKMPADLDFNVVVPWYREERLVVVLAFALAVSIFFGALALNRHRHLKSSYAQVGRLVEERTRQLELANHELMHSQKMNALGTLAAGIAHDFNNILSIIKGSAQIIEENLDRPEKIRTRTARIQAVVQQGAEVVDALLGFSRSEGMLAAPCDLNAVVADTCKLLGDRFRHETEVRIEAGANLPKIAVPRDLIQQILLNFIFNAEEAMTGRKRVELQTAVAEQLPGGIYLQPAPASRFVLISVRDHGAGIPPEIRPRIFEPFFTTKNLSTRRGTGLGLSMVYELAKKIHAGLAVESQVGIGSTFTLILPVIP